MGSGNLVRRLLQAISIAELVEIMHVEYVVDDEVKEYSPEDITADELKNLLHEYGVSHKAVADELGISRSYVTAMCNGNNVITKDVVDIINDIVRIRSPSRRYGVMLRYLRKVTGYSAEYVANMIGMGIDRMYGLERGEGMLLSKYKDKIKVLYSLTEEQFQILFPTEDVLARVADKYKDDIVWQEDRVLPDKPKRVYARRNSAVKRDGTFLREMRHALGVRAVWVAERLTISLSYLYSLENGKMTLVEPVVSKVKEVFNVSDDDFERKFPIIEGV